MSPCLPQKSTVREPSYLNKYPCKIKEKPKSKTCPHVVLQDLIDLALHTPAKEPEKKKKLPCEDVRPPSKKKFEQLGLKNICAMPYSRRWTWEEQPCRDAKGLPKWFGRLRGEERERNLHASPRVLDDYEQRLWAPICKPPESVEEICQEPIDDNVCVFCLGCFYDGGILHDLFDKVPLIKKQSELYGDEIAQRIGIRTRITVHKKCYDAYVDVIAHKKEKEGESEKVVDERTEEDEESDDLNCGEEEQEEEEEEEEDEKQEREKETQEKGKKDRKEVGTSLISNVKLCLKKFELPAGDLGKRFQNQPVNLKKNGKANQILGCKILEHISNL